MPAITKRSTASKTAHKPAARQPLHSRVTEILREKITDGVLRPGTPVSERELCEELDISRTPLREALKVLASENLVQLFPGRGAIVAPVSVETIEAKFTVLAALEGLAAGLACKRATPRDIDALSALHDSMKQKLERGDEKGYFAVNQRFHAAIVEMSGNAVLIDMQTSLSRHVRRARSEAVLDHVNVDVAIREHAQVLAAFKAADAARARTLMEDHVSDVAQSVVRHFK